MRHHLSIDAVVDDALLVRLVRGANAADGARYILYTADRAKIQKSAEYDGIRDKWAERRKYYGWVKLSNSINTLLPCRGDMPRLARKFNASASGF